jgi:hypothetical protein
MLRSWLVPFSGFVSVESAMTPKNGGKIELRLGPSTADSAEYDARLQTADASFRASVRVGKSAGAQLVEFGDWTTDAESPPPEWLTADARAALKAALRTSRAEGRWPRRITRWRPEPGD